MEENLGQDNEGFKSCFKGAIKLFNEHLVYTVTSYFFKVTMWKGTRIQSKRRSKVSILGMKPSH